FRGCFYSLIDRSLQPLDASCGMLDFGDVVEQHGALGHLIERDVLLDPGQVLASPGSSPCGGVPALAQQELPKAVPGSELIALGRLPSSDQIPQGLVS